MTFKDQKFNFMTFQVWKMKFLNFMTFQVFHDLYEPCQKYFSPGTTRSIVTTALCSSRDYEDEGVIDCQADEVKRINININKEVIYKW